MAIFEFRITGLEKKIDRLDARVDAKFTVFSWMIGVNMALTIAILGLLLPASGVR